MNLKYPTLRVLCGAVLISIVVGENKVTNSPNDREEILGHIRSIFEAYIRQDRAAIRATHAADWTGFQGPSTKIERGVADYMVNAELSLQNLQGTGYEILDTEVQLYGDVGIVYYVARFDYRDREGKSGSLPLRSVDIYRREKSGWIQCGSHITPIPQGGLWGAK
jgi:ketosteroid isomerase-like protein